MSNLHVYAFIFVYSSCLRVFVAVINATKALRHKDITKN